MPLPVAEQMLIMSALVFADSGECIPPTIPDDLVGNEFVYALELPSGERLSTQVVQRITGIENSRAIEVVSGEYLQGDFLPTAHFTSIAGLLLEVEYGRNNTSLFSSNDERRRNRYDVDMATGIAALAPGQRVDATAVETSSFGFSTSQHDIPASVEFLGCETLTIGEEAWEVAAFHVRSGGRTRSREGDEQILMQEKTVYLSSDFGWPVKVTSSSGSMTLISISTETSR